MNTMEVKKAKQIYESNNTAQALFQYYADPSRRRRAHKGGIELARVLHELNGSAIERDYYTTWKLMERAGFGKLVIGRSGKPSRFKLRKGIFMKEIAQAAIPNQTAQKPKEAVRAGHALPAQGPLSMTLNQDGSITISKGIALTEAVRMLQDAVA